MKPEPGELYRYDSTRLSDRIGVWDGSGCGIELGTVLKGDVVLIIETEGYRVKVLTPRAEVGWMSTAFFQEGHLELC